MFFVGRSAACLSEWWGVLFVNVPAEEGKPSCKTLSGKGIVMPIQARLNTATAPIRARFILIADWLDLQHVTALFLLFIAFSLAARPADALEASLRLLGLNIKVVAFAMVFAFAGGILIGAHVRLLTYRWATLPLAIYALILVWYGLTTPTVGLSSAAFGLGIWLVLQVRATKWEEVPDATRTIQRTD